MILPRSSTCFRPAGLAIAVLAALLNILGSRSLVAQTALTTITGTIPTYGQVGVEPDQVFVIRFSQSLQPSSLTPASVTAICGSTVLHVTPALTPNGKVITGTLFAGGAEVPSPYVTLSINGNILRDTNGVLVDADGDGVPGGILEIKYITGSAPSFQLTTAPAVILGMVFDVSGSPLPGAHVTSVYYPGVEGAPPLPVPPGVSNALGQFMYTTVPITGSRTFLVGIRKSGYSEALRQVTVLAGSSIRVDDAYLQPVTPPVQVLAASGATLQEPTNQATLTIPPGALQSNSMVGVTHLSSAAFLRDILPQLVSQEGTFTDLSGSFQDPTNSNVTLRVPNIYNLPPNTPVPFGKVDHNTLVWSDLRDLWAGQGQPPGPGRVTSDGMWIDVQFDHFCSICTGYCLPYPQPNSSNGSCSDPNGDPGKGPGEDCGNSTISRREGYLRETIDLPTFREFNREVGLSFGYANYAASPSVTLSSTVDYNSTRPVERTAFRFSLEGRVVDAVYGFSSNNQKPVGTWIWNGRNGFDQRLPTGSYPYTIQATSLNANTPVAIASTFGGTASQVFTNVTYPGLVPLQSNTVSGRTILVNLEDSPYGAGWSLLNEQRLHFDPDGSIILIHGNADWERFDPDPSNTNQWLSPSKDPSALSRNPADGSYRRLFPDGTLYVFSPAGRIQQELDRYGYITHFAYTSNLLTQITTPTGFRFDLGYIGGKLRQVTDSTGRITYLTIDGQGNLVLVTDVLGSVRGFTYDSEHLLLSQTGPRGERSAYTYVNGRATEARSYDVSYGPLLRTRTFDPSVLHGEAGLGLAMGQGTLSNPIPIAENRVDVEIDGRGGTTRHTSNLDGRPIRIEDQLNRITQFTYHPSGLLASRIRPDGSSTQYDYNAIAQPIQSREMQPNGSLYSTSSIDYNGPYAEVSRIVDAERKQTTFQHDALGNVITVQDHDGGTTTYSYTNPSLPNLPTMILGPTGQQIVTSYDTHGNPATVTDFPDPTAFPQGRTYVFQNNATGHVQAVTDPLGHLTTYSYDLLNRLTSLTDSLLNTTSFNYDVAACGCATSNVTKVTFANLTTMRFEHDGLNRLLRRIDQLGRQTQFVYDPEGSLLSLTNRNGELIQYQYDLGGQLVRKELPGSELTFYTYDALGNLSSAIDPFCTLGFQYDFLSRVTRATTQFTVTLAGGQPLTLFEALNSTYDRVGNRLSLTNDSGSIHNSYTYDNLHRLRTLALPTIPGMTWTFGYDAAGLRTSLTPAAGLAGTVYSYDLGGQLTTIVHQTNPPVALSYNQYDGTGNLLSQTTQIGPASLFSNYQYDSLSQLTSASFSAPFGEALTNQIGSYDAANHLLSDGTFIYGYDQEGRQILRDRQNSPLSEAFQYDAEGKLRQYQEILDNQGTPQVTLSVEYTYDPLGRRTEKRVNGIATRFLYDNEDIILELDGQNRPERSIIHGPGIDEPLAAFDQVTGTPSFLHADRLGSIIATSDSAADLTQASVYDEYGSSIFQLVPVGLPLFTFTGRAPDLESGKYYFRARYYDSFVGRFLTEDPIQFSGGLNLYAYVDANPVNSTDPSGECPWCVGALIGGLTDLGIQLAFNGFNLKCVNWWEVGAGAAAGAIGGGLFQKLGSVSTEYAGVSRPTYRLFKAKNLLRLESHPLGGRPNWYSYPHWHVDALGDWVSGLHLPFIEPLVGGPSALHNASKKGDCDCTR